MKKVSCRNCGGLFRTEHHSKAICSTKCRSEWKVKCVTALRAANPNYRCAEYSARERWRRAKRAAKLKLMKCRNCGVSLEGRKIERNATCCSEDCRRLYRKKYMRERAAGRVEARNKYAREYYRTHPEYVQKAIRRNVEVARKKSAIYAAVKELGLFNIGDLK